MSLLDHRRPNNRVVFLHVCFPQNEFKMWEHRTPQRWDICEIVVLNVTMNLKMSKEVTKEMINIKIKSKLHYIQFFSS